MTPSILRMTLAVALIFGIGVVANIFGSQKRWAKTRGETYRTTAQIPASRVPTPKQVIQKADAQRVADSVRRQLKVREYLAGAPEARSPIALAAAILAFEFDHNLVLTAQPTDALLEAMIFAHAPVARQRPATSNTAVARKLIGEVQRALHNLGYGEADITMALDAKTRAAIRKFERARGLQVSGRISAPLISSLGPAIDVSKVQATMRLEGQAVTLTSSSKNERDGSVN